MTMPNIYTLPGGRRIVADDEFIAQNHPGATPAGVATQPASTNRWITQLAFDNRFTNVELDAIEAASSANTAPGRALKRNMGKLTKARYVDLDRQDTRAGVQALEASGLIAQGRASEVLDSPVQEHERP